MIHYDPPAVYTSLCQLLWIRPIDGRSDYLFGCTGAQQERVLRFGGFGIDPWTKRARPSCYSWPAFRTHGMSKRERALLNPGMTLLL